MKNYKKVISLVLTLAMIVSTATVTFAAVPTTSQEKADVLNALGLFDGVNPNTYDANITGTTDRQQAMKMIASALDWTIYTGSVSIFPDVASWAQPYVAVAVNMQVTNGIGNGMFGGQDNINARQLQTWIDRALGNPIAGSWAANAGLDQTIALDRGDLVDAIFSTLKEIPIGGTESLIANIVGTDAALLTIAMNAGLLADDLYVSGIVGESATVVKVIFTQPVNSIDAAVLANYSINNINPASIVVASDNLSATLTFALATNVEVTAGVVVVEPIQSSNDDLVLSPRYVSLLTYEDTTLPTITEVTSLTRTANAASVTVKFSEPIQNIGAVKIDGVVRTATGFVAGDTQAIFNTGLSLSSIGNHTVQFIGLTDMGLNVAANVTESFTVMVDTTAPTAMLTTSGDHTIRVTFDKNMSVPSVTAALASINNVVKDGSNLSNLTYTNATLVAGSDNKQFDIVMTSPIYAGGTSKMVTVVFPATMTDSIGNPFVATTDSVTLNKDTVQPVITSVVPKLNGTGQVTAIKVTVSEGLLAGQIPAAAGITIVDSNGILVTGTFLGGLQNAAATAGGDTSFLLPVTTVANKTGVFNFTLPAGFVTDNALVPNMSAGVGFNVDFGTATASSTFTFVGPATIAGNVITITYVNAVKGGGVTGSATDINNYAINGSVLPVGTTATLDPTQKIVTITLQPGSVVTTDGVAVFTINNVAQVSGETVVPFTQTLAVTDNTQPVMDYALLNTDNSITIGFSEVLTISPVNTDVVVKVNGSVLDISGLGVPVVGTGLNAGKYVLALDTLVLNDGTVTYVDMDASGTNNAGDIVLATEVAKSTNIIDGVGATSVTALSQAGVLTAADAATNVVTSGTSITVK